MGYDNLSYKSVLYSYDLRVDLFFFFLLAPTFTVQIVPSEIMFDADIGSSTTCHLHCTQIWSPFILRTLSKLVSLVEGGQVGGCSLGYRPCSATAQNKSQYILSMGYLTHVYLCVCDNWNPLRQRVHGRVSFAGA